MMIAMVHRPTNAEAGTFSVPAFIGRAKMLFFGTTSLVIRIDRKPMS
jgi:hypothetical protein